jgi:hypothetical protein
MGHRLSSLPLGHVTDKSWSQLILHLPNLLYVDELTVNCLYNNQYRGYKEQPDSKTFMRAIRTNGCLHRINETTSSDWREAPNTAPLCTAAELRQMRRYCERNQTTRKLLQYLN